MENESKKSVDVTQFKDCVNINLRESFAELRKLKM